MLALLAKFHFGGAERGRSTASGNGAFPSETWERVKLALCVAPVPDTSCQMKVSSGFGSLATSRPTRVPVSFPSVKTEKQGPSVKVEHLSASRTTQHLCRSKRARFTDFSESACQLRE